MQAKKNVNTIENENKKANANENQQTVVHVLHSLPLKFIYTRQASENIV